MLTVKIDDRALKCDVGENLYKLFLREGVELCAPCGGNGTCGKCKVLLGGTQTVKACEYIVTEDITVDRYTALGEIATSGRFRDVNIDGLSPFIAVDIGTTTVVAYLISGGEIVDTESGMNAQKSYGDDVITRIQYVMDNEDGCFVLHEAIRKQVSGMVSALCGRNGVKTDSIAISGNTTMLHLYAGVSPASIGVSPFTPVFTDVKKMGNTILLPSVSGYVGADTVMAILASGMHLSDEMCLLVDIGTNGEIALGNKNGILTCSAAAGPAFEGAQISCGCGGIAGAINSVKLGADVTYTTIGGAPPIGICGSAILDIVAQMLALEMIDETGFFEDEELVITDGISVTAGDIRQVQLAKAAIAAGVKTLLEETSTDVSEIKKCFLAGGFGSFLNKKSACDIGLLPAELLEKIEVIGNAAGMGTVLWQVSSECRAETDEIMKNIRYTELSDSSFFQSEFIECMNFAP